MALTKSFELPTGITLPESYIRIASVDIKNEINFNPLATIHVEVFLNQASRVSGDNPVFIYYSNCQNSNMTPGPNEESNIQNDFDTYFSTDALNIEGANTITNAYEFIKNKQQIFGNSIDC